MSLLKVDSSQHTPLKPWGGVLTQKLSPKTYESVTTLIETCAKLKLDQTNSPYRKADYTLSVAKLGCILTQDDVAKRFMASQIITIEPDGTIHGDGTRNLNDPLRVCHLGVASVTLFEKKD